MPTLAPDIDFNVAAEQPVAPTDFRGLTNLVGTVVEGVADAQEVDSSALDQELMRGLRRVRALHDQGRRSEAYALESRILNNYTAYGGNLGSTRIKTAVQGITGRDPEDFGNSPEEVALQDTLKSEEYQAAWLGTFSTHPDATPDERQQLALGHLSVKEGREAVLAQAEFGWSAEGEAAFMGQIDDFENAVFGGVLVTAKEGGDITLEDAQQAQMAWMNFRRQVEARRPANVSNEEWSSITSRLDQTQKTLEYLTGLVDPQNVGAQSISEIQQAIKNSDIDDVEKNLMLQMLSADPEVLATFALPVSRMAEIMQSLQLPEDGGLTPGELRDASVTDPYPQGNAKNKTSQQVYNDLNNTIEGSRYGRNLASNGQVREQWGMAVTMGLSNMNELAARGEWMTDDQYDNIFSDQFFEQLDSIKDVDPRLHSAIVSRAQLALTTNGGVLQERISSVGAQLPADYDPVSDEWILRPEGVRRATDIPAVADYLIEAAVRTYGGDEETALTLMMRDGGMALRGDRKAESAYARIMGDQEDNLRRVEQLTASMEGVLSIQRRLSTGTASNLDPQNAGNGNGRPMPSDVANDVDFHNAVASTASRLNLNPDHLMRAMDFETRGTFDPSLEHAGSSAVGLIGFLRSTAADLGYSTEELQQMTRAEQMAVVEQYLQPYLKDVNNPTFGDIYLAIHYPAAVGKGNDYVLYSKGSKAYKANKGLDKNGDGRVTAGEAISRAWGGSSSSSRTMADIGAAVAGSSPRSGTPDSEGGVNVSAPFRSSRPEPRPSAAPTDTSDPADVVDPETNEGRTASEAATQQQKEALIALFPALADITEEQFEQLIQTIAGTRG